MTVFAPGLLSEEHEAFRDSVKRFVRKEIEPCVNDWDEQGEFPRELYTRAAEAGLLGLGFPEEYGGMAVPDPFYNIVLMEEFTRAGSGGIIAGLFSLGIGAPPIANLGTEAQKQRFLPPILAGEKISALAITEPGGGSDVANLATTAKRDGDDYILNGTKTYITSGMRADYYTVAVRTGEAGMGGISLIVVERDTPGFSQTPLKKMGWWCSDTATLYFDHCRVPAKNLLGEENGGFMGIMLNFNSERLGMSAQALGFAQLCIDEATDWARERHTFGRPLISRQVIRHKLVDMQTRVQGARAWLYILASRVHAGETPVAELCMLKNQATEAMEFCANEAMQIFGGAAYMRGEKVERVYRETKVMSIGGGSREIMKDLAARQLGY